MQKSTELLLELVGNEICGNPLDKAKLEQFDETDYSKALRLANVHDIANIASLAIKDNGIEISDKLAEKVRLHIINSVWRYENIKYEFVRICDVLEKAEIPFIPLKGSVIRKYYPSPAMRTSCDIDILVHVKDLENAAEHVIKELNYTSNMKDMHNISLFSQTGVHFELHFDLIEKGRLSCADEVLKNVWDYTYKPDENKSMYLMKDEMLYFHHIAHMAMHMLCGGCGMRSFLDVWVLNHRKEFDFGRRAELLNKGGISKFASESERLSEVWFGNSVHNETTEIMEDYVLKGGIYGSISNAAAIKTDGGARCKASNSVANKIWKPYDTLKYWYPKLYGRKYLLPFYEVKRWFKLIFGGAVTQNAKMNKYRKKVDAEYTESAEKMIENLELNK